MKVSRGDYDARHNKGQHISDHGFDGLIHHYVPFGRTWRLRKIVYRGERGTSVITLSKAEARGSISAQHKNGTLYFYVDALLACHHPGKSEDNVTLHLTEFQGRAKIKNFRLPINKTNFSKSKKEVLEAYNGL